MDKTKIGKYYYAHIAGGGVNAPILSQSGLLTGRPLNKCVAEIQTGDFLISRLVS